MKPPLKHLSKKDEEVLASYISNYWNIDIADKPHTLHDLFTIIHVDGIHAGRDEARTHMRKALGIENYQK